MSAAIMALENNIKSLYGVRDTLIENYRHAPSLSDKINIDTEINKIRNFIDKAEDRLLVVRQDYHD